MRLLRSPAARTRWRKSLSLPMLSNNSEVKPVFLSSPCLRIWEMWTLLSGIRTSPAAFNHRSVLHVAEILVSRAGWGQGEGKVPLGTKGCS